MYGLKSRKIYYMTFGLNTTKNEFVLEDGKIIHFAEEHAVLGNNNQFPLDLLFPFEAIMQKGCK